MYSNFSRSERLNEAPEVYVYTPFLCLGRELVQCGLTIVLLVLRDEFFGRVVVQLLSHGILVEVAADIILFVVLVLIQASRSLLKVRVALIS